MGLRWRLPTVLGAAMIVGALVLASTAFATPPSGHKVTICHATNSDTNPYIQETVDIASSGYLQAGHSDHTGPIWYEGAKDAHVQWGDIIPPYVYAETDPDFEYAGLNWTDEGQAIWENDCKLVTETTTPSESEEASVEPSVEPSDGPSFEASVGALTANPSEPATDAAAPVSSPSSGAMALVVALGLLLASLVILSPRPAGATKR